MTTRAAQIELLTGPLTDPTTGSLCSGYSVEFYAAGTSTAKNVWTEKEKTNPFTTYTLDSGGKSLLYGDGVYKIVIKNTDGTAVLTLDYQKIQATTFSVVQKSGAYTATPDDDVILCDGTFTVSLQSVANFGHPLIVKNIGVGTITIDPNGVETIDGDSTYIIGDTDSAVQLFPDTTSNVWRLGYEIIPDGVTNGNAHDHSGGDGGQLVSSSINFTQEGASAVTRTSQNKLRDIVSIKDWDVTGDGVTDDYAGIMDAITDVPAGTTLYFPVGTYLVSDTILIEKSISLVGESKFNSIIVAGNDFTSDKHIVNFNGSTGSRLQNVRVQNLCFLGDDDNLARGITFTWVNKSIFENLYFYNLYRGCYLDNAWGNNWRNISAYGITQETFLLYDEFSANHFDHCEARSASGYGIKLAGGGGGISFTACDIEGVDTATKAGIYVAPVTGKKITGLSIKGCYFERIKGSAIELAAADAAGVSGIEISGCYIFGGHAAHYSSTSGQATNAIIMANVQGFDISNNVFEDWETNAFYRDGTELYGKVWNNRGASIPNLTNSSNAFSSSVDVQNNFAGRRVEYLTDAPSTGTWSVGDLVWNSGPSAAEATGWICVDATGTGTWKYIGVIES